MQMGEINMLTRQEEIDSAKRIEATRTQFRRSLLCNDFVLLGVVDLLEKVLQREVRLDRTVEISVTNTAEKKRVLQRLVPNLHTIRNLMIQNQADYRVAVSRQTSQAKRHASWRKLVTRRNKVVRMVEEMNLRIARLIPLMDQLHKISDRMIELKKRGWWNPGEMKTHEIGFSAVNEAYKQYENYEDGIIKIVMSNDIN